MLWCGKPLGNLDQTWFGATRFSCGSFICRTSELNPRFHCIALEQLPAIHKDPFDRMLVAQAVSEGMLLLTSDSVIAEYPGPIQLV